MTDLAMLEMERADVIALIEVEKIKEAAIIKRTANPNDPAKEELAKINQIIDDRKRAWEELEI